MGVLDDWLAIFTAVENVVNDIAEDFWSDPLM